MTKHQQFSAILDIIGINPFVPVPDTVLQELFLQAGKNKSPIPVKGTVNKLPFKQSLVRYSGEWRLYINLSMLKDSPRRIGETIRISIMHDPEDRTLSMDSQLKNALDEHPTAKATFETLRPSLQHEINRYICKLKTEESKEKNILRAIGFLLGENSFVGNYSLLKKKK
ncbi:MAG TPA: YdeI/OmpD-associated family protein [Flavipsychrobacter sp.]|nr:YdeI/OmpD-associated family protein [Flavipsychrobacter sp.]